MATLRARPVGRPTIAYVGWAGNGNLGDDAMLAAHRRLMPEFRFVHIPNAAGFEPVVRRGLGGVSAVCLGGGTLILNGHFRATLERVLRAVPQAPRFMLGTGVEDVSFQIGRRHTVMAEVAQWAPLLREFDAVRVRGPLSQNTLSEAGITSEVTGDVALGLDWSTAAPTREPRRRPRVGLNFGLTDDLYGDQESLERALLETAGLLDQRGMDVALLATTTQDHRHLSEVAGRWSHQGILVVPPARPTMAAFESACRDIDVLLGEKLHSVVLAARAGVPAIALEYRPKCRDFQASIGQESLVVRTDALVPRELADLVSEVCQQRLVHNQRIAERVADLAGRLARAARDQVLHM